MYIMDSIDEENRAFVAFIKAFAYVPVLLHLASDNDDIRQIIREFQNLPEDAIPDKTKTDRLRGWVDSKMDAIGEMTTEEINHIIEHAKLNRLNVNEFYTGEYKLPSKKRKSSENCLITMEPIRRDEYYVDFLDNGKPYKVAAIVEYYKRLKNENERLEKNGVQGEWKTPLRNTIATEDRDKLDDLVNWYESKKQCTRSTRKQRRGGYSKKPHRSKGGKSRKTRRT